MTSWADSQNLLKYIQYSIIDIQEIQNNNLEISKTIKSSENTTFDSTDDVETTDDDSDDDFNHSILPSSHNNNTDDLNPEIQYQITRNQSPFIHLKLINGPWTNQLPLYNPKSTYHVKIYKQLLYSPKKSPSLLIHDIQASVTNLTLEFTWLFIIISSGHFAASIFNQSGKTIAQKTFHRYTTRKKQGGSQAANDNKGKHAKSAGATLRRYNEQALKDEVQELLQEWKSMISACDLIFIRAKNHNRQLLDFDSKIIDFKDHRIRTIPFTTKQPTLIELKRCFDELMKVKIDPFDETKEIIKSEPLLEALKDESLEEFLKICDMIKRGKLELLKPLLKQEQINKKFNDIHGTTLLHVASVNAQPEIVKFLLEMGSDATIQDTNQMTAYQIASSKAVRDIYRKHIAYNEVSWNWNDSGIPGPLTDEMEQSRKQKEKEKKKKQKEKLKKTQELAMEAVLNTEPDINESSIGNKKGVLRMNQTGLDAIGITPERRKLLDREKRALAAEARMRTSANTCSACKKPLSSMSFEKMSFKYCSMECVKNQQELHD